MKERRAHARGIQLLHWRCCHTSAGSLSPAVLTLKCSQDYKKKKKEAGTVLSPLYHRALTGWVSHPDIFPLALELVSHVSCLRCCFSFPAADTVAMSEQGGCVCVCTNARRVGDVLSFNFSLSSVALRAATKTRRDPSKGRGVAGEMGSRERRRWEAGCWGADTAELYCVLTSSMRLAQGWITGQQAGLYAAVALVTHSNEVWVSTDTS